MTQIGKTHNRSAAVPAHRAQGPPPQKGVGSEASKLRRRAAGDNVSLGFHATENFFNTNRAALWFDLPCVHIQGNNKATGRGETGPRVQLDRWNPRHY